MWLQIDEVAQAMLCDPSIREQSRQLGEVGSPGTELEFAL